MRQQVNKKKLFGGLSLIYGALIGMVFMRAAVSPWVSWWEGLVILHIALLFVAIIGAGINLLVESDL